MTAGAVPVLRKTAEVLADDTEAAPRSGSECVPGERRRPVVRGTAAQVREQATELMQQLEALGSRSPRQAPAAEASADIAELTRLMDSTEPIEPLAERRHPWAADPTSVRRFFGQVWGKLRF